jgi:DNA modification methylase
MDYYDINQDRHQQKEQENGMISSPLPKPSSRAQTHPPRYLMHKYWSRKPHNLVREAIERGCPPGGRVLDLFCGSGVAAVEAALSGRQATGIDINPLAVNIAEHTLRPVREEVLSSAFEILSERCRERIYELYRFPCTCGELATLTHVIWDDFYTHHYHPSMVKYRCPSCGKRGPLTLEPGERELARGECESLERLRYPLHQSAHQSVESVDQLFSERNQTALEIIYQEILDMDDGEMRDWMLFTFGSALPQASRLVFVIDHRGRSNNAGRSNKAEMGSWTIPNYWIPRRHFEVNAWNCFEERFKKVLRGKRNSTIRRHSGEGKFICADAVQACEELPGGHFDMLFADPPYGGAVPYMGLSLMWAAWTEQVDALHFDQELTIPNNGVKEGTERFREQLTKSFSAARRLLKPDATVVLTFNHKLEAVWNALEEAMLEAGYRPGGSTRFAGARPSAKSLLAPKNSMKGDVWLTYYPK